MIKLNKILALTAVSVFAVGVGYSSQSNAAPGPSPLTANASAEILAQITLEEMRLLDFGKISPNGTASTVVIDGDSTGARSSANAAILVTSDPGQSGQIEIKGANNASITITVSSASGILANPSSDTMAIGSFTHSAGATPALNASGELMLYTGATLSVGATQPAGVYTGTYTVTAVY